MGVIIYIVLGGYRPFRGEGEDVMRLIRYGEYKFHKKYWRDPEQRIAAAAALQSPWIHADETALGTELSDHMISQQQRLYRVHGSMPTRRHWVQSCPTKDLKLSRAVKTKFKGAMNTIIANTNKLQSIASHF
jgi:hypothetical protein